MSPPFATSPMTGADLRHARLCLQMTQADFGERLGITNMEVWRKEKGERPITTVQALAVSGLLLARAMECEGRDPLQMIADFTERSAYQI